MCVHSRVIEHLIVTLLQEEGNTTHTTLSTLSQLPAIVRILIAKWEDWDMEWEWQNEWNGPHTHTHTSTYITLWQEYNVLYKCIYTVYVHVYSNNTCTYYIYIHLYNTLYSCHLSALITPKRKQHFWSRKMKLYNGSDIIQINKRTRDQIRR